MLDFQKTRQLLQLTAQINSTTSTDDLLREVMESAKIILNGDASSLILHDAQNNELIIQYPTGSASAKISGMRIPDSEGVAGWVWQHQKPVIINDVSIDSRFRGDLIKKDFLTQNLICVPLKVREGKHIGVLQVINKLNNEQFNTNDQQLLEALAHQAAIALERQRLLEEMLEQERKLTLEREHREKEAAIAFSKGVEEERARIARELHDHILGLISTTMRKMQQKKSAVDSIDFSSYMSQTLDELDELSGEIRSIMEDLKPMSLQHFGLCHALEILALKIIDSSNNRVIFHPNFNCETVAIDDFALITLYRISQEALSNSIKHAKPKNIWLSASINENQELILSIKDDGLGFDLKTIEKQRILNYMKGGNGLLNMEYRASTIQAKVTWKSEIGVGTEFIIQMPLIEQ